MVNLHKEGRSHAVPTDQTGVRDTAHFQKAVQGLQRTFGWRLFGRLFGLLFGSSISFSGQSRLPAATLGAPRFDLVQILWMVAVKGGTTCTIISCRRCCLLARPELVVVIFGKSVYIELASE